ncbi:hypothetical protein HDU76_008766, partial [Blyttiomyces sp. JEL0837]
MIDSETKHFLPRQQSLTDLANSLHAFSKTLLSRAPLVEEGQSTLICFTSPSVSSKQNVSTMAAIMLSIQTFHIQTPKPTHEEDRESETTSKPSPKQIKHRISARCTATLKMSSTDAFVTLSEAIGARRGECSRVQIVPTTQSTHPFSDIPLPTTHNTTTNNTKNTSQVTHVLYSISDYGDEPRIRQMLSRPSGSAKHLTGWLTRGNTVELTFRGGGDSFLIERASIASSNSSSSTPASSSDHSFDVNLTITNMER